MTTPTDPAPLPATDPEAPPLPPTLPTVTAPDLTPVAPLPALLPDSVAAPPVDVTVTATQGGMTVTSASTDDQADNVTP